MKIYVLKRLIIAGVTLLGMSMLIFVLMRLAPGNITDIIFESAGYVDEADRHRLEAELGIQQDAENWVFEAEWDQNGARCFYGLNRTHSQLPCFDTRVQLLCGQQLSFNRGVLMRNETPGTLGIDLGL